MASVCIIFGVSQIAQIVKEPAYNAGDLGLIPGSGRSPKEFLPGESHGQRSLVGYRLWGRKESDPTEQLTHTHIHAHDQRGCLYLEGWEGERDGREVQEGGNICIPMADSC